MESYERILDMIEKEIGNKASEADNKDIDDIAESPFKK